MVSNTHNQNLLDVIAGGASQLSTPFITIPGAYTEEYWNLGSYNWLDSSPRPTRAVVTVVGTNNLGDTLTKSVTLTNFSEPNGWTFASILPEPEAAAPEEEGQSGGIATPPVFTPQFFANTPAQPFSEGFFGGNTGTETLENENSPATPDNGSTNNSNNVLGEQADEESGTPLEDTGEVLGFMDSKLFNLAWYWYLVIFGALVGGWLALAAAIRRRRELE